MHVGKVDMKKLPTPLRFAFSFMSIVAIFLYLAVIELGGRLCNFRK